MGAVRRRGAADGQLAIEWPGEQAASPEIVEDGERWRPVPDFEGFYDVSDWGRVRSWRIVGRSRRRSVIPKIVGQNSRSEDGYRPVHLRRPDGFERREFVHRLVLEAFVGPCPEGMEALHSPDRSGSNCRLDNLRWGTPVQNAADAVAHGSVKPPTPTPAPEPVMFFDPFIPLEALMPWEAWKEIPGVAGYEVSSYGRIRSYWVRGGGLRDTPEIFLVQRFRRSGYWHAYLRVGHKDKKNFDVHRLVLMTFSPQPDADLQCRHVDNRSWNTHISNLRWGTCLENIRDKHHHGTMPRGEGCSFSKLTTAQALEVKEKRAAGKGYREIAADFGVSSCTVRKIDRGLTWKHLAAIDVK